MAPLKRHPDTPVTMSYIVGLHLKVSSMAADGDFTLGYLVHSNFINLSPIFV